MKHQHVIWTTTGREEQCRVMIEKKCDPETFERCVIPKNTIKKNVKGKWITTEEKLFAHIILWRNWNY